MRGCNEMLVGLALAIAMPVHAQAPPAAAAAEVFPTGYFRDAAPANAGDMLERVPGFTLIEADADVRGYSGAAGNVLVDGARPTSKREETSEQLQRIPASAVERIELIRSGTPGVDMGGYAVLANIVLRHEAQTTSTIETGLVASTDGWSALQAELQYTRRRDDRRLELAFAQEPELDDDTGDGTILVREAGAADATLDWSTRTTKRKRSATAAWQQPFAAGELALNAALRSERAHVNTAIGSDAGERIAEDEEVRESEFGGRYSRDFGARTHLDAMATRQRARLDEAEDAVEEGEQERFRAYTDSGETIGRIELAHTRSDTLAFNASLEAAANFLQGDARLEEDGVEVVLPGSRVRVEEQRAQAAFGLAWQPRPAWALEAGLRLERSILTQSIPDGHDRSRSFVYPKPRVALRWTPGDADEWRLAVSREVGQLEFEDFVASASLESGTVSAGNAELRPERSWRGVLGWEHRFGPDTALTLDWTHERIDGVVDRVLVVDDDELFDAPGNIGDGRRDTLAADLALSLEGLG
ncbi:MAG: TonB-dependent receptor, partial [Pseudomonadota bacterium]|nr:TonB-dependent receptor [Pseudomonadota bacterium]